jgi:4-hydroxybenzoate polyprenyltransferase
MVRDYLELMRPANVMTALADVLAGFAIAGLHNAGALPWLLLSTASLYAGGVVLNDVFDRDVDRVERPERPIPSGRVPVERASVFGAVLLCIGIGAAAQATRTAALIAATIAALVVLYDSLGKRHFVTAPINMGLCRALNLLLGVAAVPVVVTLSWPLAVIPLLYIGGVTTLSRGEVHGGHRGPAMFALVSLTVAWIVLTALALRSGERAVAALALAILLGWRLLPSYWQAWRTPSAAVIRAAVQRGVLSLVLLDATIGAAFAGPLYALIILSTGIAAAVLARRFAVS